ncbi:ATP-grasp peptide maturase system methyltransferase [Nonomuraea sp. NPDC026600]|uniref:ATP-grasp peptide maturase system methyltransferase n=1 Tax=Nonomuraea sp. NPDC026600 TaxID=3155363 RepID=UPI0033D9733F
MTATAASLRLVLAGSIASPDWHNALATVPRERFLGDALYLSDPARGDLWTPLRRSEVSEEEWLSLAYSNETWVTQVGDLMAEEATGVVQGEPRSSSTLPGLIVRMLEAAQISEGDTVLEIGTGTGYSTVLMCQRLGNAAISSVECDPTVAARAREAIIGEGYTPTLVEGDGLYGYAENAPYDRLIATCSVRTIPREWMSQVRPGGTITAPMRGWMGGVAFAHITMAHDGTASGRFLEDDLYFITARSHLPPPRPPMVRGIGDTSKSRINPAILENQAALWVAQLAIPQAQCSWGEDGTTFLLDVGTGSRAEALPGPAGEWTVRQHGPVRLWDAVEKAIEMWQEAGSPHQSGFGLTVTREGQQVWLGNPTGLSWSLPA